MNYLGIDIPDEIYEYLSNDDKLKIHDRISSSVSTYIGYTETDIRKFAYSSRFSMRLAMEIKSICDGYNLTSRIHRYINFIDNTDIARDYYLDYFHLLNTFSDVFINFNPSIIGEKLFNIIQVLEWFKIPLLDTPPYTIIKMTYNKIISKSKEEMIEYTKMNIDNPEFRLEPYLLYRALHFVAYRYIDNALFRKSVNTKSESILIMIKNIREAIAYSDILPYVEDIDFILLSKN